MPERFNSVSVDVINDFFYEFVPENIVNPQICMKPVEICMKPVCFSNKKLF